MTAQGRDRKTLINYFRSGALPGANHFGELIESTVNKVDDGFDKHPKDGLKLAWLDETNLMSFYTKNDREHAVWRVAHEPKPNSLKFVAADATASSLTIGEGKVGINVATPTAALDVDGVMRAGGRMGQPSSGGAIEASVGWKPLTDWETGCNAFEVVAGVGRGKSRFAMLHAIAINANNPTNPFLNWLWPNLNRPINTVRSGYGRFRDRLELKWQTDTVNRRKYRLMIRSRCPFKGNTYIHAYVTRLWFDPAMEGSASKTGQQWFDNDTQDVEKTAPFSSPKAANGRGPVE